MIEVIINSTAIVALCFAFIINKDGAIKSLKIAFKSFFKILPTVLAITIVIGLIQGFIPPEWISNLIGQQSGIRGVLLISIFGAIVQIPAIVSFPLAASLLEQGASITAIAAFITSLTMVGTVTLPLEIKELGKTLTILRNGLSFVIAIIIALIMGMIL